jgi:carbon-monoxide dehydrogenase small subunit
MALYDLLKAAAKPTEEEIRRGISGVLCRCTGYVHIVEAVERAIENLAAMSPEERGRWFPL